MATQSRKTSTKKEIEADNIGIIPVIKIPSTGAAPITNPPVNPPSFEFDDNNPSIILSTLLTRINQLAAELSEVKRNAAIRAEAVAPSVQTEHSSSIGLSIPQPITISDDIVNAAPDNTNPGIKTMFSRFMPSKISQKFVEQSIDQLESYFTINKIFNDNERYLILKLSIEPETYQQVASTINSPPNGDQYNTLKKAIIKTFTDSEAKRIKSLLNDIELGDRRPSALLSEMCSLYSGPKDKIFTELFISRLPATVRGILMGMKNNNSITEPPLEILAQWADSILEQIDGKLTVSNISSDATTSHLKEAITNLTSTINAFHSNRFKQVKNPKNVPKDSEKKECYFHKKFGNKKHENMNCRSNCKYFEEWLKVRAAKN